MSPEASERLKKWMYWLPEDPPVHQFDEAMKRLKDGIDPPEELYTEEWPDENMKS